MLDLLSRYAAKNGLFSGPGIELGEALPNIDQSYRELRPLFFLALGRLARQGFVTSPADGLDLIHDFFADEWAKLKRTYNPSKGNYRAYAYRSFVQFVRPRIVRIQRFQNYKLRPDEVESALNEPATITPNAEMSYDHQLVTSRIDELPHLEREILSQYVYSKVSERELAKTFSLSRHRLRELLVEALGQVLVRLDRPNEIFAGDWQVALALWRDARSISQTAKYLRLTEHQVRAANKRNFEFLTRVLSIYHPHGMVRSHKMATKVSLEPRELFKRTIFSPGNEELLELIKQRAQEIMDSLDGPDAMDISEEEMNSLDPLWVARVYETFATVREEDEAVDISADPGYAHIEAEFEVGQAYKLSLIPGLPAYLADLPGKWLSTLPEVDDGERADLLTTPSACGAEPLSGEMARYGVTPLTVLDATNAVARLLQRYLRSGRLNSEKPIILSHYGVDDGEILRAEHLADEVSQVAVCREPTARVLLDWSIEVAQMKPLLFNTFTAETAGGESLALSYTGVKQNDLHKRWGLSSPRLN
jgi:RNA polymerase sigma factor (sigma-70 family)